MHRKRMDSARLPLEGAFPLSLSYFDRLRMREVVAEGHFPKTLPSF
jgi:hypothetical protein